MRRRRSYNQYCSLAHALDRVGDRWTLLLIRQLLTGPKRFKDLVRDLPGIGTNLLAARLRELKREGVVEQRRLPPPAGSWVYELTPVGRGLEPALVALGRWGLQFLGRHRKGQPYRPSWAMAGMKITFRPEASEGVRETYEYCIDSEVFHARVGEGSCEVEQGPAWQPAFILTTDVRTLLKLASRELELRGALAKGVAQFAGSREAFARSVAVFGLPPLTSLPPASRPNRSASG